MDLDVAFVCKLITEKSLTPLVEANVTSAMLMDAGRPGLEFVQEFFASHGQMPTVDTLEQNVGEEFREDAPEPLNYYIDLVKKRWVGNTVNKSLIAAGEFLDSRDPDGAVEKLKETLKEVATKTTGIQDTGLADMRETTDQRWKDYEHMKNLRGQIDGMPFPWDAFNNSTMGIHKGELWFIVARLKLGKCLREGTLIPDADSGHLLPIEKIVEQKRRILTFSKEFGNILSVKPSEYWDNGVKPCLRLETRLGNVLEATTDEPMLTPGGWRQLSELKKGDKVAAAAYVPTPRITVSMDESLIVLLAGLLAEGGCTGHRTSFTNTDKDIVKEMAKAIGEYDCEFSPVKNKKDNYDIVGKVRYKNLVVNLTRHFNIRKLSKHKRIPREIFSLPNEQLSQFLAFFWSCDGCIASQSGSMTVGLASEGLIDDLRHLLLRFGIVTKKRYKQVTLKNKKYDSWELDVRGQSKTSFVQKIGAHLIGAKKRALSRVPKTRKPNDDSLVTTTHLKELVRAVLMRTGAYWKDFWEWYGWKVGYRKSPGICGLGLRKDGDHVPRKRLRAFVAWVTEQGIQCEELAELFWMCSDQIAWDSVKSVKDIGQHQTYDLTVDNTHCFVAAGFVVHNTWTLVALAEHFFRKGNRVLLASMEMPISKIARRLDTVYTKLPFGDFKKGLLDNAMEVKYIQSLAEWKGSDQTPLWICGKGRIRTPQDLELLIEELKPDIVLIDGVYLMRVAGMRSGGSKWEKVSMIADELQDLAQRKLVPIMATTQFNRSVTKKKVDAGSEDIGYSYELAQNADGLIGLFQTDEMRNSKEMLVKLMEHREGEPVTIFIHWDFTQADFSQKSVVKEGDLVKADDEADSRIVY